METQAEMLTNVLSGGLTLGSIIIALVIGFVLGGWNFGDLLKRVDITVNQAELPGFIERLNHRLAELGFVATGNAGEFCQGGQAVQDVGAFTHAKTPKLLRFTLAGVATPTVTAQLALQYKDTIVIDTGEVAYRDAVLDFISGRASEMKPVPNRSFLAVCTAVGGVLAWVGLAICKVAGISKTFEPVLVIGVTYTLLGIYAMIAILRKPDQATGLVWAIFGVMGCVTALGAVVVLKWPVWHL